MNEQEKQSLIDKYYKGLVMRGYLISSRLSSFLDFLEEQKLLANPSLINEIAILKEACNDETLSDCSFRVIVEMVINPEPITDEDMAWAKQWITEHTKEEPNKDEVHDSNAD